MEEFTGLTGPMKASLGRGHTSQEWKRVHGFPFLVSLVSLTCPGENSLGEVVQFLWHGFPGTLQPFFLSAGEEGFAGSPACLPRTCLALLRQAVEEGHAISLP